MHEQTEWHRVVYFNRLAEIAAEYLRKGSKIYVEGALRTRKWQDKEGQDRYTTEIVGREMQMLDSKGGAAAGGGGSGGDYESSAPQKSSSAKSAPPSSDDHLAPVDDFNDDIPF